MLLKRNIFTAETVIFLIINNNEFYSTKFKMTKLKIRNLYSNRKYSSQKNQVKRSNLHSLFHNEDVEILKL